MDSRNSSSADLAALKKDPDIAAETATLARGPVRTTALIDHRLNWRANSGGHQPSTVTKQLLAEVGGPGAIRAFTNKFYLLAFKDDKIDQFIRDHDDPHGERFADWVVEKFSGDNVWTLKRAQRKTCPFHSHGQTFETPHDRSSAHFAAWHSPKRISGTFGDHFKLDDCRVWMRLHFLALRESGAVEKSPSFCAYYQKFIGHFVSVYERTATQFARESFRWSADVENVKHYYNNSRVMEDVIGLSFSDALRQINLDERNDDWPYE